MANKLYIGEYKNASITRMIPDTLAANSQFLAATHIGNYALFGGGSGSKVDAYNSSLTRSSATALNGTYAINYLAATHNSNYAFFAGGRQGNSDSDIKANVYTYNSSLTRSTATSLSVAKYRLAGTHVGNYALFGGGYYYSGSSYKGYTDIVDAYNNSKTRSTPTALSLARYDLAASHVGNYALFGGGYGMTSSNYYSNYISYVVDAYNTSLTRSTPAVLSVPRQTLAATHIGDYVLFGGGYYKNLNTGNSDNSDVVDAYNSSLTRSTPTALSAPRRNLVAAHDNNFAYFGGGSVSGVESGTWASNVIDAYDASLTRSIPEALSVPRSGLAATHIGDYVLFGGGRYAISDSSSGPTNAVDAYKYSLAGVYAKQLI